MPKTIPMPKGGVAWRPPDGTEFTKGKGEDKPVSEPTDKAEEKAVGEPKPKREETPRQKFMREHKEAWDRAHPKEEKAIPKKIAALPVADQVTALEEYISRQMAHLKNVQGVLNGLKEQVAAQS